MRLSAAWRLAATLAVGSATLLAALALAACSQTDSGGNQASTCTRSLDYFCVSDPCVRTYADSVARLRTLCHEMPYWYAAAGTCGPSRFTDEGGGYGGYTMYFDESGKLFAGQESEDVNAYCNHTAFEQNYGPVPTCERIVTEVICDWFTADLGAPGDGG